MTGRVWDDAPEAVRQQVTTCVGAIARTLGGNLVGVYLYGSLAVGCFNPRRSDVDLLIVTHAGMAPETKRDLAELLLRLSGSPSPIEVSFLTTGSLAPWRHPASYDFHFSEDWRAHYERALRHGEWTRWVGTLGEAPHMAVNVTLARKRGMVLFGSPANAALPSIPEQDFVDAILSDGERARERVDREPGYAILNHCRTLAYLRERRTLSKHEGAVWALAALPSRYHHLIAQALEQYGDDGEPGQFDMMHVQRFLDDHDLGEPA